MKNCANCREGKKHGYSMIYCRFYGIDISANYNRCGKFKPRIVEVENEEKKENRRSR